MGYPTWALSDVVSEEDSLMAQVLLVDDEPDFVAAARELLRLHDHEVESVETLEGARSMLARMSPDVLLLDLMLPDGNGLELLEDFSDSDLKRVVLITGHPGIKSHIRALSGPSVSYLTKPIDGRDLITLVADLQSVGAAESPSPPRPVPRFGLLVGESPKMQALYEEIERVARSDSPILVVGETGTGKELVAEALHRLSGRGGDFVAVNCGSLSRELAGSELFGHEKGSFTGAVRKHLGFFKRANKGTLFLDELTEMPLDIQPHFLRVLETNTVLPVGSEQEATTDTRVVAATNRDPNKAVADKRLRQDLFYRLSVFPLHVPPLRERTEDIALLVQHFVAQFSKPADGELPGFSDRALERLMTYGWPGNVRELKHVVQRALIMRRDGVNALDLPQRFESPFEADEAQGLRVGRSIRDVERELIERTLAHLKGDKRAAAETLGISLNTLYNRLNAYRRE